jgi:hypothetical protein
MMNGKQPVPASSHLSYVNSARINALYNQPPLFNIVVKCKPVPEGGNSIKINVNVTPLEDIPNENLRVHVVITENNIDYEKRYGKKSVNGVNEFNHIMRAMLPDAQGIPIAPQKKGIKTTTSVDYTNDDKEINFKEVRIVVFVQDETTKEVLGAVVTKEAPIQ